MNPFPDEAAFACLPVTDKKEKLLLQAAILPPEPARRAWEQFCRLTPDIEKATERAFPYFPAIASRLAQEPDRVEHFSRLRSVLRHSWARRQFVLSRLLPLLQKLNEQKVEFILLKGLAVSFSYQPYRGERSLIDVGLLVTEDHVPAALSIFEAAGWRITSPGATASPGVGNYRQTEILLCHPSGESLTVQTQLFPGPVLPAAGNSLWKKAVDGGFPGTPLRILNPFHQFLHTCLLASPRDAVLELNPGLVDAAHFLTPGFPWRRLELVTHRFGVISSVRRVLLALADAGFALPGGVVRHWRELRIEASDQEFLAARLKRLESLPPVRRYLSKERTRTLAELYIQRHAPAGFFAFWRAAAAYVRGEHHLRPYNRRAYFYFLIVRSSMRRRRR